MRIITIQIQECGQAGLLVAAGHEDHEPVTNAETRFAFLVAERMKKTLEAATEDFNEEAKITSLFPDGGNPQDQ